MTGRFEGIGGERDAFPSDGQETQLFARHSDNLAEIHARVETQNFWLRNFAAATAIIAIVAAAYLEWEIMKYIMAPGSNPDSMFFVVATAPILSATAIVVFFLIGVFRGFHEKDMSRLPTRTIFKTATSGDTEPPAIG